jgi:hypothetical protein
MLMPGFVPGMQREEENRLEEEAFRGGGSNGGPATAD